VKTVVVAVVCLAAGYLLRLPIDRFIQGQIPFVTFFPAVLAASLLGGRWAGLLVVIIGAPLAQLIFAGNFPIATTSIWIVVGSAIAWTGGMARTLSDKLRKERDELAQTRAQLELVVKELGHRARNTFAVLNALTTQSAQGAASVEEFRDRLLARIRSLTSAYSLLSDRERNTAIDLKEIVATALAPFEAAHAAQMKIAPGESVSLTPSTGVSMVLCLHELATNAVKYGALSVEQGRVTCAWNLNADGSCTLSWRESGGPRVAEPTTRGFGSRVIMAALSGEVGASVQHRFEPEGVACDLTFRPREATGLAD
jgi:two-component sensor histidine kinase